MNALGSDIFFFFEKERSSIKGEIFTIKIAKTSQNDDRWTDMKDMFAHTCFSYHKSNCTTF